MYINIGHSLQTGDKLIADKHPKSGEVKKIKDELKRQWIKLNDKAQDKGNKLRQASAQYTLNRALDDAQVSFYLQDIYLRTFIT